MTRIALGCVLCIVLSAGSALAQPPSDAPWFGRWRLNIEKSTYSPGPKPKVVRTFTMTALPRGWFTYTMDRTDPDGGKLHAYWTGKFDSVPYPEVGNPNADFNRFRKIGRAHV